MPPSWHPVPVCVPQLRCRRAVLRRSNDCCRRNYFLLQQRKLDSEAGRCCGRHRCHSGGFFLGLCRLRGILSLPASTRRCCTRAILHRHDDCAASIRKFGLEIKNRCTQEGLNGEKLASIPKFGLEIKNRCTKKAVSEENLASIPKSGPEIKNRCMKEGVNGEKLASIPKSGLEIKNRCTKQPIFSTSPSTRSIAHPSTRLAWMFAWERARRRFGSGGKRGC